MPRRRAQYTAIADDQSLAQPRRCVAPCGRPAPETPETKEFATEKPEPEPAGRTQTERFVTAGQEQHNDRAYARCGGAPRSGFRESAAPCRSSGGQQEDLSDLTAVQQDRGSVLRTPRKPGHCRR